MSVAPRALYSLVLLVLLVAPVLSDDRPANDKPATVEQIAKQSRPALCVVTQLGRDSKQGGLGTGFVISADGLIVTNLHVIGEGRAFAVELADGKKLEVVSVHASDRVLDLAVIRVNTQGKELAALPLGDVDQLAEGAALVAMGNPHGLKHSVVSGVNSGLREIEGRRMIQLAMPIEPGNSGGPVLDLHGRVHGVVTMKSAVTENLGFAVAINALKPLLEKPNPIPLARWQKIGQLDPKEWAPLFGANWRQAGGRISVSGEGQGFGGRSLCVWQPVPPEKPYEIGVAVKLDDESGAAGLIFASNGGDRHYGFYPSNGKVRFSRFEGPDVFSWKVLRELPAEGYRSGDWNQLKVRVGDDGKFACFVNDKLIVELQDDGLTGGKVGLAKFRQTQADFRHFRVAKSLDARHSSPEKLAKLTTAIEKLPKLESLTPDGLQSLAEQPADSVGLLRERAKELERQAEELRRVAADVHVRDVVRRLAELVNKDDNNFDLLRAGLLISQLDEEEIDVDNYVRQVDRMAAEIKQSLPADADEKTRLAALNKFLFAENGFHGSRFEYYHRANSYLNRVIDDREGIPITLSVLYMELGQRLGLAILGIGLPGHFMVKHAAKDGSEQLLDVYNEAKPLTRDDAAALVKENSGQRLTDDHLHPSTRKEIVTRMLRNLLGLAQRKPDREAMLRYLEAIVAIDADAIQERGMRAMVRFETGRRQAAIADLDWFLSQKPAGADLDKVQQLRDYMERNRRP